MGGTGHKFNAGVEMRKHWRLQEDMIFLNHGSFGATPTRVLEAQHQWRQRMELQPVSFFVRDLPDLLRSAAHSLASFLGSQSANLAFVDNATAGINAVLRSYPWKPGDELLLSEYAYPAVKSAAHFVARQFGIVVREFAVPFPLRDVALIAENFEQAITPRTRVAILDHVSSPLAIRYPLPELLAICRLHSVHALVDGAHAPGMLPLNLSEIDADWYVGNCHKWLFAAKGCAFIHAQSEVQSMLQPPVISLQSDQGFPVNFDWTGTRDVSAWLAIEDALGFYHDMGGNNIPPRLNHLATTMAAMLVDEWQIEVPAPLEQFGAMVTLPVPWRGEVTQAEANGWRDRLWADEKIEVPFFALNGRLWLRISAQLYNDEADYRALSQAIKRMI